MKRVAGRNGGTIKRMEKGDPGNVGGGRPPGSRSFKTLFEEALSQTQNDKNGKPIELKKATAMQIVAIVLSKDTDDNAKLKAFQIIRDTMGEQPVAKTDLTSKGQQIGLSPLDGLSPEKQAEIIRIIQSAKDADQ